tara:strand:- start:7705 stop:7899 length:195 start_codon:yes stop_codon:yes gene_type:complete
MKQRIKYKNKYMAFRISLVEQMLKDNLPVKVMASIFNTTEQNIYYDLRTIANSKYEDRRKMNNG